MMHQRGGGLSVPSVLPIASPSTPRRQSTEWRYRVLVCMALGGALGLCLWLYAGLPVEGSTGSALLESMRRSFSPSRAVVICTPPDKHSLRLAWTQITVLREQYGMARDAFLVYHANELDAGREEVRALLNITGVRLMNLVDWYQDSFHVNRTIAEEQVPTFRGYHCKPAALVAAPYRLVAVVDLDVMLTASPFELASTEIFGQTGAYLFRDQRCYWRSSWNCELPADKLSLYQQAITELWSLLNPELDSVEDMPETLTQSPPFTGQSYDVGESAVVVVDRSRNRPAMDVLRRMCSPDLITVLWDYILGDKEMFWLSMALSGTPYRLNPYAWVAVGGLQKDEQPEGGGEARNFTCCLEHMLAQWAPLAEQQGGGRPRLLYMNGDGVETMMQKDLDPLYVGNPALFEEQPCLPNYCSSPAIPLPPEVTQAVQDYRAVWKRAVLAIPDRRPH